LPASVPMRALRLCLLVALCASGAVLLARAILGPFRFLVAVSSPVNAEGTFALAAVGLLLTRGGANPGGSAAVSPRTQLVQAFVIVSAVAASFWPSLSSPLNSDDFIFVHQLRAGAGASPWRHFTEPSGGPRYFRPLAMVVREAEMRWAGIDPLPRHIFDLALHAANCLLVLALARRLGLRPPFDLLAALLFGLHGSRPEAVCWFSSRFETMAALFVLCGLLAFLRWNGGGSAPWLFLALASCLCGLLSKETAFAFPILLTLLVAPKLEWRPLLPFYLLTAAVFWWRWWVVGGIGGYQVMNTGEPTILQFHPLHSLTALFPRLWAVLWFPVNWSVAPGIALKAALVLAVGGTAWLVLRGTGRARMLLCAGFALVSALPAQHLLLIGADLEKSRYLYLASAGFALFLGFGLQAMNSRRAAVIAGVAFIVFQFAALEHNLAIWLRVTDQAFQDCATVAKYAREGVVVVGLPHVVDGVYNISNGLPECVALHFGAPYDSVHLAAEAPAGAGGTVLFWDPKLKRVTARPN
jgi:hypothetical protein